MIATLTGTLQYLYTDRAIVSVQGVGYELHLSSDGVARLGEVGAEVFLFVHTHVREDAIVLFGFLEEEEKELFLLLISVSGIGPKLALAILSGMRVADFCEAITDKDLRRLTALPGVGRKTAERLCVELHEKMGGFSGETLHRETMSPRTGAGASTVADVLSALVNLGYTDPVARQALVEVKRRVGDERFASLTLEELLKEGLRALT